MSIQKQPKTPIDKANESKKDPKKKVGRKGKHLPIPNPREEFLSQKETAELLRVGKVTVGKWAKQGFFNAYQIGGRVLYKYDEVINAIVKLEP